MTYDMYRAVFLGAAILAGVMLLVSIILFFGLDIPKVIGDLSGRNAKKAIRGIQEKRTITKTVRKTEPLSKKAGQSFQEEKTELLAGEETELLTGEDTVLLNGEETAVLANQAAGNTMFSAEDYAAGEFNQNGGSGMGIEIDSDITYIHTSEEIK